jgi:hypothetical protein
VVGRIRMNWRTIRLSVIGIIIFAYGIGVGYYQWFPFGIFMQLRVNFFQTTTNFSKPSPITPDMFTDTMLNTEKVLQPIVSRNQITTTLKSMIFPANKFYGAYENISILDANSITLDNGKTEILKVVYRFSDKIFNAYAYKKSGSSKEKSALIIPGSGSNQSHAIYNEEVNNYHFGIIKYLGVDFNKYILIKPNEDILAIHNGKLKLNYIYIYNYLINNGSSYSGLYILNSLAILKYMKNRYKETLLAGLSQGGSAALIASLQSFPDKVIISSGFSLDKYNISGGGHFNIIIPNIDTKYDKKFVLESIKKSVNSKFLFTYGLQEFGEAEKERTCKYFKDYPNVMCIIHKGSHEFPKNEIIDFIGSQRK